MSVAELDRVAQEQLHALADQSHAAISATQSKLLQANSTAQHLTQFVKVMTINTLGGHGLCFSFLTVTVRSR